MQRNSWVSIPLTLRCTYKTTDELDSQFIERGQAIEAELMDLVWRAADPVQPAESNTNLVDEKKPPRVTAMEIDDESGTVVPSHRPTHLMNTVLVAITMFLIMVMLGAGFRQIAIEIKVDKNYIRLAFIALVPLQIFFTLVCY
jgi:hypothetical protein